MSLYFQFHELNQTGIERAQFIAEKFDELLDELTPLCESGYSQREFALVKTKLEEASFFAKKSMALQPKNQKEK